MRKLLLSGVFIAVFWIPGNQKVQASGVASYLPSAKSAAITAAALLLIAQQVSAGCDCPSTDPTGGVRSIDSIRRMDAYSPECWSEISRIQNPYLATNDTSGFFDSSFQAIGSPCYLIVKECSNLVANVTGFTLYAGTELTTQAYAYSQYVAAQVMNYLKNDACGYFDECRAGLANYLSDWYSSVGRDIVDPNAYKASLYQAVTTFLGGDNACPLWRQILGIVKEPPLPQTSDAASLGSNHMGLLLAAGTAIGLYLEGGNSVPSAKEAEDRLRSCPLQKKVGLPNAFVKPTEKQKITPLNATQSWEKKKLKRKARRAKAKSEKETEKRSQPVSQASWTKSFFNFLDITSD